MTSERVREIAAGLSEAQRARLLALKSRGRTGAHRGEGHMAAKVLQTMPDLVEQFWRGDANGYRATTLGQQVRAHLNEGG